MLFLDPTTFVNWPEGSHIEMILLPGARRSGFRTWSIRDGPREADAEQRRRQAEAPIGAERMVEVPVAADLHRRGLRQVLALEAQELQQLGQHPPPDQVPSEPLHRRQATELAKVESLYFPSMTLLIGLSTLMTIMIGGLYYITGQKEISIATIVEFVIYINMLTFPVSAIGWTASMIQPAAAG